MTEGTKWWAKNPELLSEGSKRRWNRFFEKLKEKDRGAVKIFIPGDEKPDDKVPPEELARASELAAKMGDTLEPEGESND